MVQQRNIAPINNYFLITSETFYATPWCKKKYFWIFFRAKIASLKHDFKQNEFYCQSFQSQVLNKFNKPYVDLYKSGLNKRFLY